MLSEQTKQLIRNAMAKKVSADELIAAIEAGGNPQAATVAAIGVTSNFSALVVAPTVIANSNFTAAIPAEPTKAEIDAGIDTLRTAAVAALDLKADNSDVETLRSQVESRQDASEAKIDAILASLKASGLMAT